MPKSEAQKLNESNRPGTREPRSVVIVGGGIVGLSAATWLKREGFEKVTIIDKDTPGMATSYGNAGILASCSVVPITVPGLLSKAPGMLFSPDQPLFLKWRYLPFLMPWLAKYIAHATHKKAKQRAEALLPLIANSLKEHQDLAKGTGAERWLKASDYLFLYQNREKYMADRFGWNLRKELGLKWEEMDAEALAKYDPILQKQWQFSVKFNNHGYISDPACYVSALSKNLENQGVQFLKGEVKELVVGDERVKGVRVSGQTINSDCVIISAGIWSKALAKSLGFSVPIESERGYHLELFGVNVKPRAPIMVTASKFVATPMDGRLRLAGIVEFGGLNAPPSRQPIELLRRQITQALPGIEWKEEKIWMGHRPSVADSIPVIGQCPGISGVYFGFGHDHVGLTGGPKTGRLLANMIAGKSPEINLAPYEIARFHGGAGISKSIV